MLNFFNWLSIIQIVYIRDKSNHKNKYVAVSMKKISSKKRIPVDKFCSSSLKKKATKGGFYLLVV